MTDRQVWVFRAVGLIICFPTILAILINVFFVGFLPSLDWVRASDLASQGFAVVAAVVTFGFLVFHARVIFEAFSRFKAVLMIVGGPLIAALLSSATITFTIPFVVTLVAGSTSEQRYWVKDLPVYMKHCHNAVDLREIGGLGQICGIADELRDRLYPGAVIVVTGRGTNLGIFVQDVRIPW